MRGDGIRASAAIVPICQSGGTRAGTAAAAAAVLQMMPVLTSVLALALIGGTIVRGNARHLGRFSFATGKYVVVTYLFIYFK